MWVLNTLRKYFLDSKFNCSNDMQLQVSELLDPSPSSIPSLKLNKINHKPIQEPIEKSLQISIYVRYRHVSLIRHSITQFKCQKAYA